MKFRLSDGAGEEHDAYAEIFATQAADAIKEDDDAGIPKATEFSNNFEEFQ